MNKKMLVLSLVLLAGGAINLTAAVLPTNAVVEGKTMGEWTAEGWKWLYSIPTNQNPQLDCAGQWAHRKQPGGSVFFLPPLNIFRPPPCTNLTFSVPENKYVLVPVYTLTADNIDAEPLSADELRDQLAGFLRGLVEVHATIDGVAVANLGAYRFPSPPFGFNFPTNGDNLLTVNYGHPVTGLPGWWTRSSRMAIG